MAENQEEKKNRQYKQAHRWFWYLSYWTWTLNNYDNYVEEIK